MIKHLLLASLLLIPSLGSEAQTIKKVTNLTVYNLSQNGRYACAANQGLVTFWDTENENAVTTFTDDEYYCQGVSNDGLMAGSKGTVGAERPVLFSTDKVISLPMPGDRNWNYGGAFGITSDGKMACGILSDGSLDVMDNVTTILPFVWDIDGDNITCTALPYPEKDATGRAPQGIHPIFIAENKNRIIGREIDYSGMSGAIVVWNRTAPGEPWEYTVLGEDLLYKDGPAFPEYPNDPQPVDYHDYMTDEELAAYEQAYNDWALNGWIGDAPLIEDYILDESMRNKYLQDLDQYNKDLADFNEKLEEFNNVYSERKTEYDLDLYSLVASFNGRYVGCTLKKMEFYPDQDSYPCYYDLDDGNKFVSLEDDQFYDCGTAGYITDKGDLVITKPAVAGIYDARNSFVVPAGENKKINVYDYLSSTNNGKVNRNTFVDAGLTMNDSVFVGTAYLSADGVNAAGWYVNPDNFTSTAWALNSYSATGIAPTLVNKTGAVLRSNVVENGRIEFLADVEKVTLFDLNGTTVFRGEPENNGVIVPVKKGMYVLKSELKDGSVRTDKILIK